MREALHLFQDFLIQKEEELISDILRSFDKNQPEAYLRLTHQTSTEVYQNHIQQLFHLMAKHAIGEGQTKDIEQWGKKVSEDKVRLGLSLFQSIQHFQLIRSVVWEAVEKLSVEYPEYFYQCLYRINQQTTACPAGRN